MVADVLTLRSLNRATLARQLLLERSALPAFTVVEHLVGLQAQLPNNPYVSLWSRLERFDPDALGAQLTDRSLVRMVVMRGTIHLVTADDALLLRPLMQPVLDAEMARHSELAPHLVGVDLAPVLAFAHPLLSETPMTGTKLRAALASEFPDLHPGALAFACRNRLPLVQIPPRGVWGKTLAVTSTPADAWLGRPLVGDPSIDAVILRYLAAFGPATPADAAAWTRLTGMREVFDRLRPQLRVFADDRGRELFDLPDAPRPDPETPAPVRFFPEYDNALLSHADRTRFVPEDRRVALSGVSGQVHGTVAVDGMVTGTWRVDRDKGADAATLTIDPVVSLTKRARAEVEAEARRLLAFVHADVGRHDVRFVEPS